MKTNEDLKKKALTAVLLLVPAIVSGVLANMEAKSSAAEDTSAVEKKAAVDSTTVLKSYKPIIDEIQAILGEAGEWAEDTDKDLDEMSEIIEELRADVLYCKAYVEFDSRNGHGRAFRHKPMVAAAKAEFEYEAPAPSKPKARLPDTMQQAQQYIKNRRDQKCEPGDPLCGCWRLRLGQSKVAISQEIRSWTSIVARLYFIGR